MLDLVNRYDVGMVERRCSLGLLHKALHPVWMSSDFNRQYLQRNFARQFRILRQIHLTHSALANLRADFVVTEFCARCDCHQLQTVTVASRTPSLLQSESEYPDRHLSTARRNPDTPCALSQRRP